MVNTLQAERDALAQELQQARQTVEDDAQPVTKKQAVARQVSSFRNLHVPVPLMPDASPTRLADRPSRVQQALKAKRSCACHRVGQIDCRKGHALVRDHHRPPIIREQHGDHVNPQVRFFPRIIRHQCGVLGCRVGEASNPGPVVTRQGRRQAFHDTQIDVNMGRDVMARIEAGSRHCSSVPTTCGHSAQECADTIVDKS